MLRIWIDSFPKGEIVFPDEFKALQFHSLTILHYSIQIQTTVCLHENPIDLGPLCICVDVFEKLHKCKGYSTHTVEWPLSVFVCALERTTISLPSEILDS